MSPDDRAASVAIHATAVAIGNRGLIIQGPSRAGKSRLAVDLIGQSTTDCTIVLVGDDRILIEATSDGMIARPHPRIAGFIERRGLGLCAMPYREKVHVSGIVALGAATHRLLANFPVLSLVQSMSRDDLCDDVLAWFDGLISGCGSAARAPQFEAKGPDDTIECVKD